MPHAQVDGTPAQQVVGGVAVAAHRPRPGRRVLKRRRPPADRRRARPARTPGGPFLTMGVSVYVLYTYAQVIIGQEYLRLPGNVERFFPLLLAVFISAEAALVMA